MAKLYEYTVTYTVLRDGKPVSTDSIVLDASDAAHALSEIFDENGPCTEVISIIRGAERPYGTE